MAVSPFQIGHGLDFDLVIPVIHAEILKVTSHTTTNRCLHIHTHTCVQTRTQAQKLLWDGHHQTNNTMVNCDGQAESVGFGKLQIEKHPECLPIASLTNSTDSNQIYYWTFEHTVETDFKLKKKKKLPCSLIVTNSCRQWTDLRASSLQFGLFSPAHKSFNPEPSRVFPLRSSWIRLEVLDFRAEVTHWKWDSDSPHHLNLWWHKHYNKITQLDTSCWTLCSGHQCFSWSDWHETGILLSLSVCSNPTPDSTDSWGHLHQKNILTVTQDIWLSSAQWTVCELLVLSLILLMFFLVVLMFSSLPPSVFSVIPSVFPSHSYHVSVELHISLFISFPVLLW